MGYECYDFDWDNRKWTLMTVQWPEDKWLWEAQTMLEIEAPFVDMPGKTIIMYPGRPDDDQIILPHKVRKLGVTYGGDA